MEQLVTEYRLLKSQSDRLKEQMDALRTEIQIVIEQSGQDWTDDKGYARVIEVSESVAFQAKAVNTLVEAWQRSEDAIMRSCGEMLAQLRKVKEGRKQLQIK